MCIRDRSCTEVGLSGDHVCGSKLAIFSDNNSRIATVTASCVANSNYSSNPGSGAAWYYWLRDAYAGSAYVARHVGTDGSLNGDLSLIHISSRSCPCWKAAGSPTLPC